MRQPHFADRDDHVVCVAPALGRVGYFKAFMGENFDEAIRLMPLCASWRHLGGPLDRENGLKIWAKVRK